MKDYEINDETLAIMPDDLWNSMVLEDDYKYEVNKTPLEILDYSCKYFGSSYPGRKDGSKDILNSSYKLPILVEDTRNIIFFPTSSPLDDSCIWISLSNIKDYKKVDKNKTEILFKNNIQDYNIKIQKGNEICIKKIAIAFAGPLVNIFIAIIAFFMPENIVAQKETIIYANLMLAIFNLLPIYPLDGGRIVKEIIMIKDGTKLAYEKINNISKVTVIIITIITSIIILKIHNIAILIILTYLWL